MGTMRLCIVGAEYSSNVCETREFCKTWIEHQKPDAEGKDVDYTPSPVPITMKPTPAPVVPVQEVTFADLKGDWSSDFVCSHKIGKGTFKFASDETAVLSWWWLKEDSCFG